MESCRSWLTEQSANLSTIKSYRGFDSHTLRKNNNIIGLIKKCQSFKVKSLIEILLNIGFRRQVKGLRMFYIRNRKGIFKLGVSVAKKKIKGSVERNIIKRRIKTAYKKYSKKIKSLQINLIIFFFWSTKKIPSFRRLRILIKKIIHII